jgi:prepilin-type N-terminal cleavage/methylation domain-containing protein
MPNIRRPSRLARAFTLLEVMVVVVVLTLLMSMAIPRLGNTDRRTFQLAVDQVADLLMMYAQRDNLSPYPVGLLHDANNGQLLVMVLDGDDDRGDWTVDRLARPVNLPDVVDQDMLFVYVDGEPVSIREWPLGNTPGQDRPTLEISLQSMDGEQQVTLTLPSYGMSPKRQWSDGTGYLGRRETVDLDAQGRSREDW